jgi:hypothetical protein
MNAYIVGFIRGHLFTLPVLPAAAEAGVKAISAESGTWTSVCF